MGKWNQKPADILVTRPGNEGKTIAQIIQEAEERIVEEGGNSTPGEGGQSVPPVRPHEPAPTPVLPIEPTPGCVVHTVIYMAEKSGLISVFDAENGHLLETLDIGLYDEHYDVYRYLTFDPVHRLLYISNFYYIDNGDDYPQQTVEVLNADTNQIIATYTVGEYPYAAAVAYDDHYAYIPNYEMDTQLGSVSVIDVASNSVLATISLPGQPEYAYVDNSTGEAYALGISHPSNGLVLWQLDVAGDTYQAVATIPSGRLYAATEDEVSGTLYFVADNSDADEIRLYTFHAGGLHASTATLHDGITAMTYAADEGMLYMGYSNPGDYGYVAAFDPVTEVWTPQPNFRQGSWIYALDYDPATHLLYASLYGYPDSGLSAYNTQTGTEAFFTPRTAYAYSGVVGSRCI
jgi:YVTN family beta-propeller protein